MFTAHAAKFSPRFLRLSRFIDKAFSFFALFITAYCLTLSPASAALDILVIGSSKSFSDGGEGGVNHEKAFNPSSIATQLGSILDQDSAITESVNVVFEDTFKSKVVYTEITSSFKPRTTYHSYSLPQYFMWPEGKDARLANLRGEGGTQWDYVIITADPYLMANMPGTYAEGIKLIATEVKKGSAQPILLGQWPESNASSTAAQFNEVVYRTGNSAGLTVIPAGKAWSSFTSKDSSNTLHPTPHGAYLAASAVYSGIFNRNAKSSSYAYNDTIADHAHTVVSASKTETQYTGAFSRSTPFSMKYVAKRHINFNHTGSSSERGIQNAIQAAMTRSLVTYGFYGAPPFPAGITPVDFNLGRGNDIYEASKRYSVNSTLNNRAYGFPMSEKRGSAPLSTLYGIDKRYFNGTSYDDGTDLGLAYNMVREGQVPQDARVIPTRLMWSKIQHTVPSLQPTRDNTHMSYYLDEASGSYTYTLLSGRCPFGDEPSPKNTDAWYRWLGRKTGYETAWQMSHLQTRAPGFKILPSSASAKTVSPATTQTLKVRFMFPPESNVTLTATIDTPSAALVSPKNLIFTPSNYNVEQEVTITGLPGSAASEDFNVTFTTASPDEVYDTLSDQWLYTNNRPSPQSLTLDHRGVTNLVMSKGQRSVLLDLGTANATQANTTFLTPQHGSVSWSGSQAIYTPNNGYLGHDSLAYYVLDTANNKLTDGNISINILESILEVKVGSGEVIYPGYLTPNTADGSDFGAIVTEGSGTLSKTFTITNRSLTDTINFTGSPAKVTLTGATTEFNLSQDLSVSSLVPGQSSTFQITFAPTINGIHTATLSISSDISFNPLYTFNIRAAGIGVPTISSLAPTSIQNRSITLNGSLDTGGQAQVELYWGTSDGGQVPASWQNTKTITVGNGNFSETISGLTTNTNYFYRYHATNASGSDWVDASSTVTTLSAFPVFAALPLPSAQLDTAYQLSLTASNIVTDSDLPQDTLTFIDVSSPTWLTVSSNGNISGTPPIDALNSNPVNFTVRVDDSYGNSTQATLVLHINRTDPDLVLWYKLDEASGTAVEDSSGLGHHGTLVGSPLWSSGTTKGGLDINTAGRVNIPISAVSNLDKEVTIAFWAKGHSAIGNNSVIYATDSANNRVMNIHLPWNGTIYWDSGGLNYDRVSKAASVSDYSESWRHWAFTKNTTTGEIKIYKDALLFASATGSTKSLAGIVNFSLGSNTNGSYSYPGILDDFRVYQRELNIGEIQALKASPSRYSDWWLEQFTLAQQQNLSQSGANADLDNDSIPNILEYAFGSDPLTPNAPPVGAIETFNSTPGWAVTLNRYASRQDTNLYLERSYTMGSSDWQVVAESIGGGTVTPKLGSQIKSTTGSEPETVELHVPFEQSKTKAFYRWRVITP